MSSEENGPPGTIKLKRRRLHGACDLCRQKKSEWRPLHLLHGGTHCTNSDSAKRPGNKCSNCVAFGSDCTHVHVNQKIGQGYRNGLVSSPQSMSLGQLKESMDSLLKTILSPTYQAPTNPAITRETLVNLARYARALEAAVPPAAMTDRTSLPPAPPSPSPSTSAPSQSSHSTDSPGPVAECEDDGDVAALADKMKRSVMLTGSSERFFGPSSSVSLLQTALELGKNDPTAGTDCPPLKLTSHMRPEYWSVHPVRTFVGWEQPPPPDNDPYEFPEPDLMKDLVELFFLNVDYYIPLLHRPTFEKGVKSGLHLTDSGFAMTLLGVCALASRYSDDKRVLLDGTKSLHSCGYKWFNQMKLFDESSLKAPSLYELQAFCLAAMYLQGTSTPEKCWYLVGVGIRAALDVGYNRKPEGGTHPTVEGELRKRVFYTLMLAEMVISSTAGRSPSINPSDYDIDLPVACDDEYWENADPSLAFKQPIGKPPKVAYFNIFLGLWEIHASAQRSFYSVRRPEPPPGVSSKEWNRSMLANLDSALNAWVDSVPSHLRWDPYHSEGVFLDQSALLFVAFYHIQILVHRPFIASVDQPNLAFSSLAICTNAARSCSRIMETQSRKGFIPIPQVQIAVFVSGLVLLLGVWRGRRTGFSLMDEIKEMSAIQSCINVLGTYESRWHLAGRFRDILMSMASAISNLKPVPRIVTVPKRHRQNSDSDTTESRERLPPRVDCAETPIRPLPSHSALAKERKRTMLSVMQSPVLPDPQSLSASVLHQPTTEGTNAESEVPFQFAFYSSDLSKPFQFNPGEEAAGDAAALQQQLDELEAMLGQANTVVSAASGSSQGSASSSSSGDFLQQLFGYPASAPFGGGGGLQAFPPTGVESTANAGSHGATTSTVNTCPEGSSFEQTYMTNSLLDLQGASMWTGVPSGTDWGDWNTYITNVEALNHLQNMPSAFDSRFSGANPEQQRAMQAGVAGLGW